jgi:hypothetical protein
VAHGGGSAAALAALPVPLVETDEGGGAAVGWGADEVDEVVAAVEGAEAGADGVLGAGDRVGVASFVAGGELHPARAPTAIMAGSASPAFRVRMGAPSPARRGGRAPGDLVARVHRRMLSVVRENQYFTWCRCAGGGARHGVSGDQESPLADEADLSRCGDARE